MAQVPEKASPTQVDEQDKFIVPQPYAGDRKSQSDFAPECIPAHNLPLMVPDEDKQVDHGHWTKSALEVDQQQPKFTVDYEGHPGGIEVAPQPSEPPKESRVLGLKKRTFWILFAVLALVIVGGAVGGGVGGGMAAKEKKEGVTVASQAATTLSSSASLTASSSTTPTSTSSRPSASPTAHPGFSLQMFSESWYRGQFQTFTQPGFYRLAFAAESYIWHPRNSFCSVNFCQGSLDLGWRGFNDTYRDEFGDSARPLTHVNLVCAKEYESPGCLSDPLPPAKTVAIETVSGSFGPTAKPTTTRR